MNRKMAINLGNAFGVAKNNFVEHVKTFVLPLAVGVFIIAAVAAVLPANIARIIQ